MKAAKAVAVKPADANAAHKHLTVILARGEGKAIRAVLALLKIAHDRPIPFAGRTNG